MSGEKVKIDNYITGTKLKGFRQQKGLSLAKAAHEIGVTPAFISMVENGQCGISFEKVHSLVKLYGKTLEDITPPCRSGEEKVINLNAASEISFEPGIKAFGLAKGEDLFKLGGFRLYYEPGAEHTFYHCDGMEYVLVLEGTFEIYLQSETTGSVEVRHLRAGDTTTYAARIQHKFKNVGNKCGSLFVLKIARNEI